MTRIWLAFTFVVGLLTSAAQATGLTFLQVPGGKNGPAIDAAMWSPCSRAPEDVRIRAFTLSVSPDCPIAGDNLPLVIISHGYGGWYLGHHDTAEALADAGFVVVAINHPHANLTDMSRANGLAALVARPHDIKRTVDFMLTDFAQSARIDPERIGFFGFSQGGYTGLVAAGAEPDFGSLPPRCADPKAIGCPQGKKAHSRKKAPLPRTLTHEPRIKAMVVADPLSVVFQTPETLKDVTIPLQIWGSELGGGNGAAPEEVAGLVDVLPEKTDFRIVPNSVHMSFLTVCPKLDPVPEVCIDAPGFDRAAFHERFNSQVVAFFRQNL